MVRTSRTCYVPGCSTGYKKTIKANASLGIRNKSMFKAVNENQLEKWRKAIPRQDRILQGTDVVCESHFREEDIIRHFEARLPDGTIFKLDRKIPAVKSCAIPCIFPNLPHYLSKVTIARKPPKPRNVQVQVEATAIEMVEELADPIACPEEAQIDSSDHHEVGSIPDFGNFLMLADVAQREPYVFCASTLIENLHDIKLPGSDWGRAVVNGAVVLMCVGHSFMVEKTVVILSDLSVKVLFRSKAVAINEVEIVRDWDELSRIITLVNSLVVCEGTTGASSDSEKCLGYLHERSHKPGARRRSVRSTLCNECQTARRRLRDRERKRKVKPSRPRHVAALKISRIKNKRLVQQVQRIKSKMVALQEKCSKDSEVEDRIVKLPAPQQEAVRVCFAASLVKSPKGRRYPLNWVYECLLLRIKSRKAYEHLRAHKVLTLPSVNTLNRYIRKVKGAYGFKQAIFDCLKEKSKDMAPEDRRGTLLLDEMKLSMSLQFDRSTLEVNGFTDLGDHTPLHQRNQRGDHALVMMFQPFRGRWVQALACFLSKGCASGTILHHLVLECIILLERANFHVDIVTCDGAQWNRAMWKQFGIDDNNVSCGHPFDSSRRLWFSSDFPHLVKNLRNFLSSHEEAWTPDGIVKLKHWDAVLNMDSRSEFQLKACPKLTADHIRPKPYQKMNVARAFQFFGRNVAAGMHSYRAHHSALHDCDASIALIERVKGLISAMNSRTPNHALHKGSEEWRAITEFLDYLQLWEDEAKCKSYYFLSDSTCLGLKVSLRATLELFQFLESECGYQFLMTARLNQDALERFFGMMRAACGSNDHPDSTLFIQIFRLMSTYSLIKPPKGSSVSGEDVLMTLMNAGDLDEPKNRSSRLNDMLVEIVEGGDQGGSMINVPERNDHDYLSTSTPDFVLSYFSGYIARRARRFTKCDACRESLLSPTPGTESHEQFTAWQSEGYLTFASKRLISLITSLEEVTLSVLTTEELNVDTVFSIATKIEQTCIPLVGCDDHCHSLSEALVRFFICTRVHFACRQANAKDNAHKEFTRLQRKRGKL